MQYRETERQQTLASKTKVTLDNFADAVAAGNIKDLRVVIKADVQGSIETLRSSLEKMGNDEVTVKVLHAAVGGITECDVLLADASDAIILGFHVTATPAVREIADATQGRYPHVPRDLRPHRRREKRSRGHAHARPHRRRGRPGRGQGSLPHQQARQHRRLPGHRGLPPRRTSRSACPATAWSSPTTATSISLRRVKDEVKEVRAGTECGVRVAGFDDLKAGDTLIFYKVIEVQRTLD